MSGGTPKRKTRRARKTPPPVVSPTSDSLLREAQGRGEKEGAWGRKRGEGRLADENRRRKNAAVNPRSGAAFFRTWRTRSRTTGARKPPTGQTNETGKHIDELRRVVPRPSGNMPESAARERPAKGRGQTTTPGGGLGVGGRVFSYVSQAAWIEKGGSGSRFLPCLETIVISGFWRKTEKTLISQGFLAVFIDISCIVCYNIHATEITYTRGYRYELF